MKETKECMPSKEEFLDVMLRAFKTFDRDGNKFIDRKEIEGVLTGLGEKLSESELDYMMKYADLNGDGKIDYQGDFKFTKYLCNIFVLPVTVSLLT